MILLNLIQNNYEKRQPRQVLFQDKNNYSSSTNQREKWEQAKLITKEQQVVKERELRYTDQQSTVHCWTCGSSNHVKKDCRVVTNCKRCGRKRAGYCRDTKTMNDML